MSSYEEISTKFECVKLGMRHTKDGHVVSFALHPNDTPHELMTDPLGQRYMAVLVRLNDQDEPVASPAVEEGIKAVKIAGAMCGDASFQSWMVERGYANDMTEDSVAASVRRICGITSRKDLKVDAEARRKLFDLRAEFMATYHR